jgi:hypothetical protein
MRKSVAFIIVAAALFFYWQMKRPRPLNIPVDKNQLVQIPQIETPQIVQSHGEEAPPQVAKKKRWELPLGYYPQKKINFKKSHLWMLQGLTATAKKRQGVKEVARMNQYYIYKTPRDELENIVFDDEKRQYGVLTLELTVIAEEGVLPELAQKYGLEILKEGTPGAESILRSDSSLFFTRDLSHFVKEDGVLTFRPYVSYGLAKFR